MFFSRLFHSITVDGKNEFLKKMFLWMFDIEPRNVVDIILGL